jgi:hypothetical protein
LRSDGSVVTWGNSSYGGDSGAVAAQLNGTVDVTQVFSTAYAFAALRSDGSVVTWGSDIYGSYGGDSSAVANQLASGVVSGANIYTDDVFSATAPTINHAPAGANKTPLPHSKTPPTRCKPPTSATPTPTTARRTRCWR